MSKIVTANKLNRLWQNGILPIKQDLNKHKSETDKSLSDIATALDVMDEKVDGVVESGLGSKIVCTCTGDNAVGTVLTGTLNGESYRATVGSDGEATFMISDCGKFVITGTEDYKFKAVTVDVLYFGIYYVSIKAVAFDYTEWLTAAGLSASSYADLDAVLADEKAVRTLMTKKDSVDYLANGLPDVPEIAEHEQILNDIYVAKWVNYREYAYASLSAVPKLKSIMDESGKYGMYITAEKAVGSKALVPTLTSNTGSNGTLTVSSSFDNNVYLPWHAFDGDESTPWLPSAGTGKTDTLTYQFNSPTCVNRVYLSTYRNTLDGATVPKWKLQASTNGSDFVDLTEYTEVPLASTHSVSMDSYYDINNDDSYTHYRLSFNPTLCATNNEYVQLRTAQFYGHQLIGLVPTLTSNTGSDGGVASASSAYYNDSRPAWQAFSAQTLDNSVGTGYWYPNINESDSWLAYDFKNPTMVNAFEMTCGATTAGNVEIKIQAYVDASWVDIHTESRSMPASSSVGNWKRNVYVFDTDIIAEKWRIMVVGSNTLAVHAAQFYGTEKWQPKGLVPVMTSNTAPYGEASAGSTYTQDGPYYEAYRAFDGNDSTTWASIPETMNGDWLQYKFNSPTMAKRAVVRSSVAKSYVIQASNNGSEWVNVSDTITTMSSAGENHDINLSTDSYYFYYRIQITSKHVSNSINVVSLQFYGRQLEALVPPMTSNTAPVGEAILSANYTDGFEAYRAFNRDSEEILNSCISKAGTDGYWIGYKFTNPTIVKRLSLTFYSGDAVTSGALKLQGSNNGTTWSDVESFTAQTVYTLQSFDIDNDVAYMYYRVLSSVSTHYSTVAKFNYIGLTELQFYGTPDYDSRTYIYDHGVELMEVTANNGNGFVEKRSDNYLLYNGSSNVQTPYAQISAASDTSSYSLTAVGIDNEFYDNSSDPSNRIAVGDSSDYKKYGYATIGNSPTSYMDITSINQSSASVCVTLGGYANLKASVASWWLE